MNQSVKWLKLVLVFIVLSGCTQSELEETLVSATALVSPPTQNIFQTQAFLPDREIINAENASQVEELIRSNNGAVTELDISPDASMLAVASTTGLRVYDLESLRLKLVLLEHWTNGIGWSPDSSKLVSAHFDGSLRVINMGNGNVTTVKAYDGEALDASWSPNGKTIASIGRWGTKLWKPANLDLIAHYERGGIVWTSDSKHLLFHNGAPILNLLDLATGELFYFFEKGIPERLDQDVIVHGRNPGAVVAVFQDAEDTFVTGDGFSKGFFRVEGEGFLYNNGFSLTKYDISTKESEEIMPYDWERFSRLMEWNSDLSIFVSGSIYGDIVLIDLETQKEVGTIGGHHCCFDKIVFDPDGNRVAVSSNASQQNLFIWDLNSQEFSDGVSTFSELNYPPLEEGGEPLEFSQINDIGSLVWNHSEGLVISNDDVSARSLGAIVWDGLTGNVVFDLNKADNEKSFTGETYLSPNGKFLAARTILPDTQYVLELASGESIFQEEIDRCSRNPVAWSGDDQKVAFVHCPDTDKRVVVWDIDKKEKLTEWELEKIQDYQWKNYVLSLDLSYDGRYLAVRTGAGDVWVEDVLFGKKLLNIKLDSYPTSYQQVSWSSSGTLLAYDMPQGLIIWNAETQQEVAVLTGFSGGMEDIVWSPDGTQIATVGEDDTIRIWGIP